MEKKDIHNEVWIVPWDPEWEHEYDIEKQCIIGTMQASEYSAHVRYIGSTAIEGMLAKTIIDILVCPDKSITLEECVPDLEREVIDASANAEGQAGTFCPVEISRENLLSASLA